MSVDFLATPPEHKYHVVVRGGHVPLPRMDVLKHTLEVLDTYQPIPMPTE